VSIAASDGISVGGETMLEARDLMKTYTSVPAVAGVSFTIRPGEILGYLGPNGAGKSTTVKMLTGLIEPTAGKVLFNGEDIRKDIIGYKRRFGYVPEEQNLYGHLTGHEYLEMTGCLRGIPEDVLRHRMNGLLELFSMKQHRHAVISTYSKGMRQKILIISALLDDPDLLILDEPLSGLDVSSVLIFRKLLRKMADCGKTIFYCSHVLEVVEKVCSHVLILRRGAVVACGPVKEVMADKHLTTLEETFSHLVDDVDADRMASSMMAVIGGR
jgi:ABC-2 type transport system ATP-binding protein